MRKYTTLPIQKLISDVPVDIVHVREFVQTPEVCGYGVPPAINDWPIARLNLFVPKSVIRVARVDGVLYAVTVSPITGSATGNGGTTTVPWCVPDFLIV